MDFSQVVTSLRSKLQARLWDGSGEAVFGVNNVVISGMPEATLIRALSFPAAVIIPGDVQADPDFGEEPGLYHGEITVRVMAAIPSDAAGEAVMLGFGALGPAGRGLLQLAKQVRLTIGDLSKNAGINIKNVTQTWGHGVYFEDARYVGWLDVRFTAVFTDVVE